MLSLPLLALACCAAAARTSAIRPPNVLMVVIDDLGWDDVGFRSHEIKTPTIDALAAKGVVLDRYYVQDVCSPSRSTFMTGRYAMHTSIVDWIPPASSYGLPLNETTIAQKFNSAGYVSHAVGKWHLGFYKWAYTPTFRGFNSFTGFYSGGEDYFTHQTSGHYDMRRDPSPKCGPGCSQVYAEGQGTYSTNLFTSAAEAVVQAHDTSKPLFLYLAYQGVHAPAEAPQSYIDPYNTLISDPKRRTFAGMLSAVDEGIANVTQALQAKGMLDNTLIVFTSDNGGPSTTGDGVGARNWPLRGAKHSIWEGGVRATAFISGAGVENQGTTYTGLMHGADWLPTLSDVAGYDLTGTLPLDGVSQWAAINAPTGSAAYPRQYVVLGNSTNACRAALEARVGGQNLEAPSKPLCGFGVHLNDGAHGWKLIKGYGGAPDTWCNSTHGSPVCLNKPRPANGSCPSGWCLYDVLADPEEFNECSAQNPGVVKTLQSRMASSLETYTQYSMDAGCGDPSFQNDSHVGTAWTPWCK